MGFFDSEELPAFLEERSGTLLESRQRCSGVEHGRWTEPWREAMGAAQAHTS